MKKIKYMVSMLVICASLLCIGCGGKKASIDDLTGDQAKLAQVEKSNFMTDNTAITNIAQAIKLACSDEEVVNSIPGGTSLSMSGSTGSDKKITFNTVSVLERELAGAIGNEVSTTSNTYRDSSENIIFYVRKEADGYKVYVSGMIDQVGGTPSGEKSF